MAQTADQFFSLSAEVNLTNHSSITDSNSRLGILFPSSTWKCPPASINKGDLWISLSCNAEKLKPMEGQGHQSALCSLHLCSLLILDRLLSFSGPTTSVLWSQTVRFVTQSDS